MKKVLSSIDENLSLPLKIVVPIITTLILATWYLAGVLHDIRDAQKSSWTITHQQLWATHMRKDNPTLKVPEPLEISREAQGL